MCATIIWRHKEMCGTKEFVTFSIVMEKRN